MLRKKEMIVILLVGMCCLGTAFCADKVEKQPDPFINTSVLVEAFMVRVSTKALAEAGVNPIGQAPESISILKILSCLEDPEKAEVVSGAKVTCAHNDKSRVTNEDTFYIKREKVNTVVGKQGPVESKSVRFDSYSSGKTFTVVPRIQSEGSIRLEATYSYSGFIENEDPMIPPTQISYDWRGVLVLLSGIPTIAGAAQNDESVTFLILAATIQDSQNAKKK